MGRLKESLARVAWNGLLLSALAGTILPITAQQATVTGQTGTITELPDSPGAVSQLDQSTAKLESRARQWDLASSVMPQAGQTQSSAQSQSSNQPVTQKPVGTAAAEAPSASGVAASQPAGVAMAPAKQRRVRTVVLKTGAIIGAGVAVGSVIALTATTPSKPPGAR
jgi:hypothetical protein